MSKSKKRILAYGIVLILLTCGYFLRDRIRTLFFGRKTVAMVLEKLRGEREAEFLQSFPDLYQIKLVELIAIKETRELEVWTSTVENERPKYRKTYPFTGFSGKLGLKLRAGDGQIPEGVYGIEGLNPNSKLHLSIKIAYPNDSDRKLASLDGRTDLGGDIFKHGKTFSIGCIPIGDKNIEELFFLIAHVKPEKSSIIIMPVDFRLGNNVNYTGKTILEKDIYKWIRRALK